MGEDGRRAVPLHAAARTRTASSTAHVFDLGEVDRSRRSTFPGHTRGHSGFRISDGVFFLSDIDLTGFGPYYGDAWSDLDDFEASLDQVRDEEADFYVTFHHKGVIEGRAEFVRAARRVRRRDPSSPRRRCSTSSSSHAALDELVAHRFVYRSTCNSASSSSSNAARRSSTCSGCCGVARRPRSSPVASDACRRHTLLAPFTTVHDDERQTRVRSRDGLCSRSGTITHVAGRGV